jgi:hypothetical protein
MAVSQDQIPVTVKEVLRGKYKDFVDTVIVDDIVLDLFSADIIHWDLKEQIAKSHGRKAAELLMDHLIVRADRDMVLRLCDVMDNVKANPTIQKFSKHLREDLKCTAMDCPSYSSMRRRRSTKVSTSTEATRKKPVPKPSVDVDPTDVTSLADDHRAEIPNIMSAEYYGEEGDAERNALLEEIETLREDINQLTKNPMGEAVLSSGHNELIKRNSRLKQTYLKYGEWQETVSLPWDMACLSAVEVNGEIFVGGGYTGEYGRNSDVVMLGSKYQKCCTTYYGKKLPPTPNPTCHFGLASCLDKLYLIGGMYTTWYRWFFGRLSNQVFVYDVEAAKWKSTLPPLNHPREYPGVVGIGSHIVVAGGSKHKTIPIEIINTAIPSPEWWEVKNWHHMVYPQLTVVSNQLYIGGDRVGCLESVEHPEDLKKVYSISIASLLDESKPVSTSSWKTRPHLPHAFATMACYNSQLVAIGGTLVKKSIIGVLNLAQNGVSILTPSPTGDYEWKLVSKICHSRTGAAALNTQYGLLVVGGFSKYKAYAIRNICLLLSLLLLLCIILIQVFLVILYKSSLFQDESSVELLCIMSLVFVAYCAIILVISEWCTCLLSSSEYLKYVW